MEVYYEKVIAKNPKGTIILLHGLTGNIERWKEYKRSLKEDYNLILFDLVGHGKSKFPDNLNKYSIKNQSKLISDILKKEKIKKAILISHSYSFYIANEIVKSNPNLITSLIIISPFTINRNKKYRVVKILLNSIMVFWKIIPYERRTDKFKYPVKAKEISFFDYKRGIEEIGIKSYLAHLKFILNEDNSLTKNINVPTLLIYKEKDRLLINKDIYLLKVKIPELIIKKIDGSGHLYLIQDKEKIIKYIKEFLRKTVV